MIQVQRQQQHLDHIRRGPMSPNNFNQNMKKQNSPDTSDFRIQPLQEESLDSYTSYTNQVLRGNETDGLVVYYLPAYLRLTVRKIHHIQLDNAVAQVSGTMIITIFYGGIPSGKAPEDNKKSNDEDQQEQREWFVEQLMENLTITLNGQDQVGLNAQGQCQISTNVAQQTISYVLRSTFETEVVGDIALAPFQSLQLYLGMTLRTIMCAKKRNGKKVQFRFNLLNTHENQKLMFKLPKSQAGQYGLVVTQSSLVFVHAEDCYDMKNPQKHQVRPKTTIGLGDQQDSLKDMVKKKKTVFWQHARLKIVLYKYPFTTIFSVLLPMWILAAIVQLVFFQQNDLANRIASVGIALIAYATFIPMVRERIPPSPDFTVIELIISVLLITSMLCVVRSYLDQGVDPYEYDWSTDPFFIVSMILNSGTVLLILVMTILYLLKWKPKYLLEDTGKKQPKFNRNLWYNSDEGDRYLKMKTSPVVLNQLKIRNKSK